MALAFEEKYDPALALEISVAFILFCKINTLSGIGSSGTYCAGAGSCVGCCIEAIKMMLHHLENKAEKDLYMFHYGM